MCDNDTWAEAEVVDGKDENENKIVHYRFDVLWHYIVKIIVPGACNKRFKLLPQVASLVLVLPHSNAGLEQLFSVLRTNKTDMRSSLKLDGTFIIQYFNNKDLKSRKFRFVLQMETR